MRIAILGAGGVGGYFGARLAAAGYDVTFIARGNHLEAMRSNTRALLLDVMQEVVAAGQAKGVALADEFAQNRLAFCDTLPASMTSSMHNDLERGNRIELPWLSGAVVDQGIQLNVPTPCNRTITNILSPYVIGSDSPRKS